MAIKSIGSSNGDIFAALGGVPGALFAEGVGLDVSDKGKQLANPSGLFFTPEFQEPDRGAIEREFGLPELREQTASLSQMAPAGPRGVSMQFAPPPQQMSLQDAYAGLSAAAQQPRQPTLADLVMLQRRYGIGNIR